MAVSERPGVGVVNSKGSSERGLSKRDEGVLSVVSLMNDEGPFINRPAVAPSNYYGGEHITGDHSE